MRTLIAIPVFNEARYLTSVLRAVRTQLDAFTRAHPAASADIVVVDDGSTDATPALLTAAAREHPLAILRHDHNRGYGASLIAAFAYASRHEYDWALTMDCDEQHEPRRLPLFFDRQLAADASGADIISGTRYAASSNYSGVAHFADMNATLTPPSVPPADRRAINLAVTAEVNERLGFEPPLTDTFCGYKSHRVSALAQLDLTETGYAFPMQLWAQVAAMNLRVEELPVDLIYKDLSRTFGPALSDPAARLKHYRCVLHREIALLRHRLPAHASAVLGACD